MAENTKIEWADHTFNPWTGCSAISPGCKNCYAEAWAKRAGREFNTRLQTSPANWLQPHKWNRLSEQWVRNGGQRARVFCASLADVFDNEAPDEWRFDLFELIRETPYLDWLLLSKRIGNALRMLPCDFSAAQYPNVWIGATLVDRAELLRDGPKLAVINAAVRFWSVEPMLGDLGEIPRELLPNWVICGGESGSGSRPMRPEWVRSLRDQCAAAAVPFFFKQWGEWAPYDRGRLDGACLVSPYALDDPLQRFGKKTAGRQLDGREHDEFPGAR